MRSEGRAELNAKAAAFAVRHGVKLASGPDLIALWAELWSRDERPAKYRDLRRLWSAIERRYRVAHGWPL